MGNEHRFSINSWNAYILRVSLNFICMYPSFSTFCFLCLEYISASWTPVHSSWYTTDKFWISIFIYFILKACIGFMDQRPGLLLFTAITALIPYTPFYPSGQGWEQMSHCIYKERIPKVMNLGAYTGTTAELPPPTPISDPFLKEGERNLS